MLNRFNNFILGFCLYFGEKYILFLLTQSIIMNFCKKCKFHLID